MYHWIRDSKPENQQDEEARGLYPTFFTTGPRRSAPAELPFIQWRPEWGGGWYRGRRKLPSSTFTPKAYFTRPHDGKRSGGLGRFKDALTGEGPDVFVTVSGDKRTLMRDRPQRWQWSQWGLSWGEALSRRDDRDWREQDELPVLGMPWAGGEARAGMGYNFRTRRFEAPRPRWETRDGVWTDAQWREGARRGDQLPLGKRDINGFWQSRVPWRSGRWAGGRPRP
ncbi:hypothetical protein B0A50_04639 [Salinomyces thailandicus]|uniref:Uncharacterized protein n=1 Tax=Salinomyces thailandicus TaxID=706561 RepID=A0A4U0TVT3_9PEZI|nr:hypothetical protein B0A50_04639 [Salinomyces thailandica]